MNEKSLGILEQYDFKVSMTKRGRGAYILYTDKGVKLLYRCEKSNKRYESENRLTNVLYNLGYCNVDTYYGNNNGDYISEDDTGRYYVKNWFDGIECDVTSYNDVCETVSELAILHGYMNKAGKELRAREAVEIRAAEIGEESTEVSLEEINRENTYLPNIYARRNKELKMIKNYIQNKNKKNEFELIAVKVSGMFCDEAYETTERMNESCYEEEYDEAIKNNVLCHGSYSYHNVLCTDTGIAVTNFDRFKADCQIYDLYQFMRKILEKNDWDMALGYKMIEEYDKNKTLTDKELQILGIMFSYPEKFWKIVNYYFNSNKAWIPAKSIEKLQKCIAQQEKRRRFVDFMIN